MAQAQTKSAARRKGASQRKRSTSRAEPQASDYAKEAVSEWSDAVRYAVAAATPAAKRAAERTKGVVEATKESFSHRESNGEHTSLRDRLSPARTDKAGPIGDAADAMLERLGA